MGLRLLLMTLVLASFAFPKRTSTKGSVTSFSFTYQERLKVKEVFKAFFLEPASYQFGQPAFHVGQVLGLLDVEEQEAVKKGMVVRTSGVRKVGRLGGRFHHRLGLVQGLFQEIHVAAWNHNNTTELKTQTDPCWLRASRFKVSFIRQSRDAKEDATRDVKSHLTCFWQKKRSKDSSERFVFPLDRGGHYKLFICLRVVGRDCGLGRSVSCSTCSI